MWETWVRSLGREDPLEKEMATYSSLLAWRIPWTEEPGGLQSTGSQRVRHDWVTSLSLSFIPEWSNGFPTFFNLSLNFTIKSSWSEPQSAPSLVFADCIDLLHLQVHRILSVKNQKSLRRNGVALLVNKSIHNEMLGCSFKNDRMISVHFQGKSFNITGAYYPVMCILLWKVPLPLIILDILGIWHIQICAVCYA